MSPELIERGGQSHLFFSKNTIENPSICINANGKEFGVFCSSLTPDWHFIGDTYYLGCHFYNEHGDKISNISDWGIKQIQAHYGDIKITKENVFHYIYAALNNPAYKAKYEDDLKTEYPRVPFYDDFHKWAK